MDGGSSWPAAGSSSGPQDTTIMNQIMLRFRPIAPKPVAASSSSGSTQEGEKMELVSKRRAKRKYVRVKKNSKVKNNEEAEVKNGSSQGYGESETTFLTLQLLPESSSSVTNSLETGSFQKIKTINFWKSENNDVLTVDRLDRMIEMDKPRVIESWVMVDGMTNTLVDGEALGCTDIEKKRNLEADTCPAMISDGLDKVTWVNLAYRRMVDPLEGSGTAPELVTWLVVKKEKINVNISNMPSFACTVRIVYMKHSQTMPCDVWKMDFGGFAWRFDAQAALSLGR